ncbi:Vacuolar protein sorting-associated protein 16 [Collariella sp. IMI 366227]|nr:Vacuolar protein sorting-associated protein 16 [Collariella sp. IMI 366227]
MDTAHPTTGWEQLGKRFYRKIQLYTQVFDQDLDLDNFLVAGAPYGGAIALYRDENKLIAYQPKKPSKPSIDIYSCAGKLIHRINWDQGPIKGLGWSEDEKLLVITTDGTVRCYYDLHGEFTQFFLGNGADHIGVKSCRFYGHGLVALLKNNALVSVSSYDEPRPKLLAPPPEGQVHSWSLIPPAYTLSRSVEVLLSINQTIYVSDATECENRFLDIGPFTHIAVSPNGRFSALYTATGQAHVISSDFHTRHSEHDSRSKIPPKYFEWCGNDAVVIAWEDEVHLVGPSGSLAEFFYDSGRVHIIPVPEVTEEVFRLGADSHASILLDAVEQLEMQSPKADDNIQLIRPNLVEAVDTCVNVAGQEFSVYWQKQLLKAASFGKSVLDIYNSDDFVDMCETLRVLNAVRYFEIGLPLSYEQYQRLSPSGLIARLLNRHEYLLALKIAGYLRLRRPPPRRGRPLRQPESRTASDKLALAAKLLSDNTKEHAFELGALKEATTLLRMQEAFDRDLTDSFTGLSVNQTMFKLIRLGYHGRAKKIQSEFKVPEKVAWWIRLQALVAKRDWNEIEEISKQRKSPIGWEAFYNQTLQAGNARLAATFIPKCTGLEPGQTVTMYEKCGMRVKAAEEAVRLKDAEAWTRLLEAAGRGRARAGD